MNLDVKRVFELSPFSKKTWKVHVIERPSQLTDALLDAFIAGAFEIFNRTSTDLRQFLKDAVAHNAKIFYVQDKKREVLGMACVLTEPWEGWAMKDRKSAYLMNAFVKKKHQGKGIYEQLNTVRIGMLIEEGWPSFRTETQNPRVELGIRKVLEDMKKSGVIRDFTLTRTQSVTRTGRPVTIEKPGSAGVNEIDSEYKKLHYEQGEMYILLFTITYP